MLSVLEFSKRNGIGRSKVYEEIKSGRLKAVKVGRRTLILPEAEQEWRGNCQQWLSSPSIQPEFAGLMAIA